MHQNLSQCCLLSFCETYPTAFQDSLLCYGAIREGLELNSPLIKIHSIFWFIFKFGEKTRNPFKKHSKTPVVTKKTEISNPATGLLLGTSSIIRELVEALTGVLAEPLKSKTYPIINEEEKKRI